MNTIVLQLPIFC